MKYKNKLLVYVLTFVLVVTTVFFGVNTNSFLSSADSLSEIESQIKNKEGDKEELEKKRKELQAEIDQIESKVKEKLNSLESVNASIETISDEVDSKTVAIKKQQKKIDNQEKALQKRLRAIYIAGDGTILDVIFGSIGITDFISNIGFISRIHESDSKLLESFKAARDELNMELAALKANKSKLLLQKKEREEEEKRLKSLQREVIKKKGSVEESIEDAIREIEALEAASESIREQLAGRDDSDVIPSNSGFVIPCPQYSYLSSPFGYRIHPITGQKKLHTGLDFAAAKGKPIIAAASGKVITAEYHYSYGNYVIISHGGGLYTLYAHASALLVTAGQTVRQAQQIAKVGTTGSSTGNHLHFEVRINGNPVNPAPYLFG